MTSTESTPPVPVPPLPSAWQRGLRTLIAGAVVYLASILLHTFGVRVTSDQVAYIDGAIFVVAIAAYNWLALWAEKRWSWAKWLLLNIGN